MATGTLISIEEYLTLPVPKAGSEYDEGRVIELSLASLEHGAIQLRVGGSLDNFIKSAALDLIASGPTGYWLSPEVERGPDVSVIRRDKAAAMERFHGSLRGAPDAAFEIISPSESAADLERKVNQYLAAGVSAVFLIYPDSRHVWVYRPAGEARRFGSGDVLEIPELLPGFQLPVNELFAAASAPPAA